MRLGPQRIKIRLSCKIARNTCDALPLHGMAQRPKDSRLRRPLQAYTSTRLVCPWKEMAHFGLCLVLFQGARNGCWRFRACQGKTCAASGGTSTSSIRGNCPRSSCSNLSHLAQKHLSSIRIARVCIRLCLFLLEPAWEAGLRMTISTMTFKHS